MGNIRIKNLQVSYDNQHEVFKDVNFFLRKGATLSIIGTSGSGKTTLLRAINGEVPFKGEIIINGIDVTPEGLENVSMIPLLFEELRRRGYTEEDLEKIASGNFFNVFSFSDAGRS